MKYRISAIKPISLLLTTTALAVAIMACEEAAPRQEEPAEPSKPAGVPPSIYEPLNDVSLTASGSRAVMDIDLDHHFYDPDGKDGETLTYEASSSDSDTVKASLAGRTLILRAMAVGTAKIFVKATDKDDLYRPARFDATVVETAAPQVTTSIPDQSLFLDDGAVTINLAQHFTHERAITYTASSDPAGVVDAEVTDETLTVTPLAAGHTIVAVTATVDDQSASDHFIVVVKAGSEPPPDDPPDTPPTPADPPQKVDTIKAQEVEVGASLPALDVSAYFSPATGLTYTAVSSDPNKATATIPTGSSSLTIKGVAVGTATVTVTAADSDNKTAMQPVGVTVTAADVPYKPSTIVIAGVTKTKDVSIDASQSLQSLSPNVVSPARKSGSATTWTLTGEKRGTATLIIWNADQTLDKSILVTVDNTPPMKDTVPTTILALTNPPEVDKDGVTLADADVTSARRQYHRIVVDFSTIFKDPDGAADIDKRMAESNNPYVKIVKVLSDGVVVDVTNHVKSSFPLVVYVVDKDGAMSEKVTLAAPSLVPNADVYEVTQVGTGGAFSAARVWQRENVAHTLTFADFVSGNPDGFHFVDVFERTGLGDTTVQGTTPTTFPPFPAGDLPLATAPDAEDNPAYYKVAATEPLANVSLVENPAAAGVPTLTFKVTGSGRATVTITYHRLVGKDGDDANTSVDPAERTWLSDSETLAMNIVSSS